MKPRSTYTVTIRPGFICVADLDQGRSVTNDADEVIADLERAGYDLATNRVIYRDTRGIWDEFVVNDGRFHDYRSVNEKDLDAAIAKARGA